MSSQATLLLLTVCLTASGCAKILGIEAARCDPKLDPRCAGKSATEAGIPSASAGNSADASPSVSAPNDAATPVETSAPPEAAVSSTATPVDAAMTPDGALADAALDSSVAPEASSPMPPSVALACSEYCSTVQGACSALPQYGSESACNAVCMQSFGLNTDPSPSGNTLECRAEQAALAAEFSGDGCLEAGMTGGSSCGESCANYCAMLDQVCPGEAASLIDCQTECEALPRTGSLFSVPADSAFTFECRFYHLQLASVKPDPHCQHAIGLGGPTSPCRAPD